MEIKYNYSKKDQIHQIQKYQKTPFEGKNFLLAYQNLREKNMKIIKEKISEEIKISKILKNIPIGKSEEGKICTRILLESILKDNLYLEKNEEIINYIIKKFEVKKRIFSSYNKLFVENSSNYEEMINYILLSNICIIKYEKTENLKFLNTILKLNDLICSEIKNIKENKELNLALYSLKKELDFILKIKRRSLIL